MNIDKHIDALKRTNEQFERQIAVLDKDQRIKRKAAPDLTVLEEFRRRLGEELRNARVLNGLTRYELSKRTRVSEQQIKKIELGKLNTSINTLRTLTAELDIEIKI